MRRPGHVGGHLGGQLLVVLRLGRDRHSQQPGTVQQRNGEYLSVAAPGPGRRRRRLRAEAPVPTQIARVQLDTEPVVLHLPQREHSIPQPADSDLPQRDHGDMVQRPATSACRDARAGVRPSR